jgi:hypothetical protein
LIGDQVGHTAQVDTAGDPKSRTLLTLGADSHNDRLWIESGVASAVVRFQRAAPSGYRFGSRLLGLGLDSFCLALKAVRYPGPVLVTNPWIAIASKIIGRKKVAVIGLYATAGSRSFRLLRLILSDSPVITTVAVEAAAWQSAGGRAASVLYGNEFGYPRHSESDSATFRIFVGGSSDRDVAVLSRLELEIRSSDDPTSLVVVAGGSESSWHRGGSSIEHVGYVPAGQFGKLMSQSDVVFLPLLESGRAAGHMVTVGALESGIPVASTPSQGMAGYVDGKAVHELNLDAPLLPQLRRVGAETALASTEIRNYWFANFSRRAFVNRIAAALVQLERD